MRDSVFDFARNRVRNQAEHKEDTNYCDRKHYVRICKLYLVPCTIHYASYRMSNLYFSCTQNIWSNIYSPLSYWEGGGWGGLKPFSVDRLMEIRTIPPPSPLPCFSSPPAPPPHDHLTHCRVAVSSTPPAPTPSRGGRVPPPPPHWDPLVSKPCYWPGDKDHRLSAGKIVMEYSGREESY